MITPLDVRCTHCGKSPDIMCRGDGRALDRVHPERARLARDIVRMHQLATYLDLHEWPERIEVEILATFGDDEAAELLRLLDETNYDGELYD